MRQVVSFVIGVMLTFTMLFFYYKIIDYRDRKKRKRRFNETKE